MKNKRKTIQMLCNSQLSDRLKSLSVNGDSIYYHQLRIQWTDKINQRN